jgi:AraC-like DNA-binding protein
MALFMDFHKIENITVDDVVNAHMADLSVQEKYGVKYHQFWVNQKAGTVFCLTEGPDAKTCEMVHQIAHGNVACAITEVEAGTYKLFMGENQLVDHGLVKKRDGSEDLGYRSIVMASIRGIVNASNSKDLPLLQVPHWAKIIVRQNISKFHGREVKSDADDILLGVFNDASEAVRCGEQIQRELSASGHQPPVIFRIGISADQPVTEGGEFFTRALKLAQRLGSAAENGQVLVSSLVRKLTKDETLESPYLRYLDAAEEQLMTAWLDITDENLSNKNFNIESICKDLGVSRPQLYRKITLITGKAPNDFLRHLRMEKALRLLKQRAGNISQVALEVGYNNPSYFSKCFAEKFGYMPSEI